jgi:4-amino-4-deoxy-L-arabinose transferase-like glycosyltransferase
VSIPIDEKKTSPALILGAIFLLAIAARALFLFHPVMDSDMAIVGLMGKHILEGELPLMFYGQDYGSAIEGYAAALMFAIFGVSRYSLNLAPTLISFIFLSGLYMAARQALSRGGALLALTFAALGPFYLTWHSVLARAINIETLAAGVWLMYLTLKLIKMRPKAKGRAYWLFAYGLVSGLAFWFHGLSAYYILPCSLLLWRSDLKLVIRPVFLLVLLGFILGCGPLIYYNLINDWGTIAYLNSPRPQETFNKSIEWALTKGFGVISGAKNPGGHFTWFLPGLGPAVFGLTALAVLGAILIWCKDLWHRIIGTGKAGGGELFLLVFVSVLLVYAYLGGASSGSARYLLSWYAVLPVMLAQVIIWLMRRGKALRATAWVLALGFCLYYAAGDILTSHFMLPHERQKHMAQSIKANKQADFWLKENVDHVYVFQYWNEPRDTFDTNERVVFVQPGGGRYPRYLTDLLAGDRTGFTVAPGEKKYVAMTLKSLGADFKLTRLPGNNLWAAHAIKPPGIPATLITPQGFSAKSSKNQADVAQAFDYNACTRFTPIGTQEPGRSYTLDLGREVVDVCQLLLFSGEHHDHPNRLKLEISLDGANWKQIIEYSNIYYPWFWTAKVPAYRPHQAWQEIRFEPQRVRYIRLTQTGTMPKWYWSLIELMVGIKASPAQEEPDWDQAAKWLAAEVPDNATIWCEPGLAARLPKRLRPKFKQRKQPEWLREFVNPGWLIPQDKPQYIALPGSRHNVGVEILKSCGWGIWTRQEHGITLIKAVPPKPGQEPPLLKNAGLMPLDNHLLLDLGKKMRLSRLKLDGDYMSALGPDALGLEASLDGKSFTPLEFKVRWPARLTWSGLLPLAAKAYPMTLHFTKTEARYLRLSKVLPKGSALPGNLRATVF